MGEENNNSADQGEENVNDAEQNNENGSDDNKNNEENNEDGTDENNEDGQKPSKEDNNEDNDDDPPIRASKQTNWKNKYFAEKRIDNKKQNKKNEDNENNDNDDDENDDIAPEDEEMVDKVINKKYGDKFDKLDAQIDQVNNQADKTELDNFISENPDFKPYEAKIAKFWKHPSRNHLPIESVAYEVAGKDLIKLGAKKGKIADENAKREAGGGNSSGGIDSGKKVAEMSDAEFDAEVEKVKQRR